MSDTTPTPKQQLIEAVEKFQAGVFASEKRPSLAPMTDEQYWTDKACDKFIELIEEILP